jgi:hypothetical protein
MSRVHLGEPYVVATFGSISFRSRSTL